MPEVRLLFTRHFTAAVAADRVSMWQEIRFKDRDAARVALLHNERVRSFCTMDGARSCVPEYCEDDRDWSVNWLDAGELLTGKVN